MRIPTFYKRMAIKKKLVIIFTALILLVSLFSMLALQVSFRLYDRQMLNISSEVLNLYSTNIENELRKIEGLTFTFFSDNVMQSNFSIINSNDSSYERFHAIDEMRKRLLAESDSEDYISSISYIDLTGREYVVGNSVRTFQDQTKEKIVQLAQEKQGAITWIEPLEDDDCFIAVREIRMVKGIEPIGYIYVRINASRLVKWVSSTWPDYKGKLIILTGEGKAIFNDQRMKLDPILDSQNSDQSYKVLTIDGSKFLMDGVKSPYTGWTYINFLSYETIFQGITEMRIFMILCFAVIFLVAVVIGVKFSNGITKPLNVLSRKMRKVENGDFEITDLNEGSIEGVEDEVTRLSHDFVIMVEKINELIQENYVKQLFLKETQWKALQAQINPHFLYNTLDSINWYAKMSKQPKISIMVKSLGSLLRNSISNKGDVLTIEEELNLLADYINIQKIRYEDRLDVSVTIDEELKQYHIVKMSLQPIVENAINYGLETVTGVCKIEITGVKHSEYMEINIADNGPGMSPEFVDRLLRGEITPKGLGIGLKNINERIQLIYGGLFGLHVESSLGHGTVVKIRIPYDGR